MKLISTHAYKSKNLGSLCFCNICIIKQMVELICRYIRENRFLSLVKGSGITWEPPWVRRMGGGILSVTGFWVLHMDSLVLGKSYLSTYINQNSQQYFVCVIHTCTWKLMHIISFVWGALGIYLDSLGWGERWVSSFLVGGSLILHGN